MYLHTKRQDTYIQYWYGLHPLDVCMYLLVSPHTRFFSMEMSLPMESTPQIWDGMEWNGKPYTKPLTLRK